jgi:hypothetical protein
VLGFTPTLGQSRVATGIVLLGGDFNARIAALPNTLDTSDLCELLQAHELVKIEQPKLWLRDKIVMLVLVVGAVSSWTYAMMLGCSSSINGRTLGDQSGEFTCLANGGCSTIDYIIGSPAIWQATTHFEVIIDDTHYCVMGGDFDHKPLRLRLNIDCSFVELQHMVVTKKFFLPRFNYDKSKVEEYHLALTTSLGNLWVVDSIGHLGANELVDLLQQCVGAATKFTFGNKSSGGSCRKRHCHKPWFDVDYRTTKRELRLWMKANLDSHITKHQKSKLKNLLKKKRFSWETPRAQHMCALTKVDALLFWKKYQPRAPIMDKISAATLLEGFRALVGQSLPPI